MFEFDFPYAHNREIQKESYVYILFGNMKRNKMNSFQCSRNIPVDADQ